MSETTREAEPATYNSSPSPTANNTSSSTSGAFGQRSSNRVFFTAQDDIVLLKEVLVELPYQYKYGGKMSSWSKVATRFNAQTGQKVSGQSCHERTDRLLTHFRMGNFNTLRRRSSPKEQQEKESLLNDLNNRVKSCSRFRLSARRSMVQCARKGAAFPYSPPQEQSVKSPIHARSHSHSSVDHYRSPLPISNTITTGITTPAMLPRPPELAAAMAAQLPSRPMQGNSILARSPTAVPLMPITYPPSTSGLPGHHPPLPLSATSRPTLAPLSTVIAQAHQSSPSLQTHQPQPPSTMVTRGPASLSNFTISSARSEGPGHPLPTLPPPVHATSKNGGGPPSSFSDEPNRRGDHPPLHYCSSPSMSTQTRSPGGEDSSSSQYIPRAFFENMLELRQRDLFLQEKRIQTDQELLV
ncbi:hypothetical protein IWQ61_000868, partial [Dispira simplex]